MDFGKLREEYPNFIYNDYKITDLNDKLVIEYNFEIENLAKYKF